MPTYRLDIDVNGHDNGASSVLLNLHGGLGALNVAMGNLIADGVTRLGGALWDLGKSGLGVAMDYQSSLNMFQAVSSATGDEMAQIAAEAKRLGGDMSLPATSAGDAARAMTELAKAGLTVNNALLAGKGTLQLAAAGAIDEAQAAEIAANALNSFGLSGDKATMVADLFAAAANKSSVEVTDVAASFQMASAVFSAFQGPVVGSQKAMTDLTTAIALLGNVGIKGSDAGTSLKQMLLQLTGPSQVAKGEMKALMFAAQGAAGGVEQINKVLFGNASQRNTALGAMAKANPAVAAMGDIAYDSAGKMRPLQDIIKLVAMATKDMTDEQRNQALTTVFGADATRAMIGLMRAGPDAFNAMEASITQSGAAADLAGARMKGLGGAVEGFKSTVETALLTLAEPLLGPLETGVRAAADALSAATPALLAFVMDGLIPGVTAAASFVSAFAAAPDKLAFLGNTLMGVVGQLPGASGLFAGLQTELGGVERALGPVIDGFRTNGLAGAFTALPGVIGPALASVTELRGRLINLAGEGLGQLFDQLGNSEVFTAFLTNLGLSDAAVTSVRDSLHSFGDIARVGAGLIGDIGREANGLIGPLSAAAAGFGEMLAPHLEWMSNFLATRVLPGLRDLVGWLGPQLQGVISVVGPLLTGLVDIGLSAVELSLKAIVTVWDTYLRPAFEAIGKWLGDLTGGWDNLARGAQAVGRTMGDIAGAIRGLATGSGSGGGGGWGAASGDTPRPPGFASGVKNFAGGLAYVHAGELLMNLPGGTDVVPASAVRSLAPTTPLIAGGGGGGGGGGSFTWHGDLIVQGAQDPVATARAVREELIKLGRRNDGLGGIFGGYG